MIFLWNELFYRPIYNILIFLIDLFPGMSLGLGIVVLTIIIRAVLYLPTLKSLKAQSSMQEIQPKVQELKKKHKDNPQKLSEETMKLYKEHGVNPCGSCLPIIIQMPFLIAVFQVLRAGVGPENQALLYAPLAHFDLSQIELSFLWLNDLTTSKALILALMVAGAQFASMWLMQQYRRVAEKKQGKPKPKKKKPGEMKPGQEIEMANKMMIYFLPLMIGYFAYTYPAGLGLYWLVSTLFGVGQQFFLNKKREAMNANK